MSDKMSQEEIDMLINQFDDSSSSKPDESTQSTVTGGNQSGKRRLSSQTNLYKAIDFTKQNKLQYDNLGALKQIHEQFAKSLNNYLTMFLRCSIQADVDFEIIEQLTYQQYSNLGNKNCLWGIYNSGYSEDESKCFMQYESSFCDFFIDRSFGGSSEFEENDDSEEIIMSEINKEISKTLFDNTLNIYKQAWDNSNTVSFNMELKTMVDNVQNLNLGVMNSEMMLVIPIVISVFQISEDDDEAIAKKTTLKIGIPYTVIEPVLDKLNLSNILSSHKSEFENSEIKETIKHMSNSVDAFVGETTITFKDLLMLGAGDIVSLDKSKSEPYDVYIGGVKKYNALPYRIGTKLCLKIIR